MHMPADRLPWYALLPETGNGNGREMGQSSQSMM